MPLADISKAKSVVVERIPLELIKKREIGYGSNKQKLSYVNGPVVIDYLNKAFDYLWSWEISREWIQQSIPKTKKSKNPPYDIVSSEEQAPVAHSLGKLTVYIPLADQSGYFPICKMAHGCQSLIGGQSEQENVFKGASTDALKKSAQQLGIGLELARGEDLQAFFDSENYEDPWTDELVEQYKPEMDSIKEILASNKDVSIDSLASEFTAGQLASFNDISPDLFPEFYKWFIALCEDPDPEEKPKGLIV